MFEVSNKEPSMKKNKNEMSNQNSKNFDALNGIGKQP
jgi:hypothetical protein